MTSRRDFIRLQPSENIEGATQVSETVWCDIDDEKTNSYLGGIPGHPFPAKDPDRQRFTQTRQVPVPTGNSYGVPTYQEHTQVTTEMDVCGYHWAKQNPFQQTPRKAQALEAAEEYNQGWQDAEKHYAPTREE